MIGESNRDMFSTEDRERIQRLWKEAAGLKSPPPELNSAKALVFGLNFRVNLLKGLQAAWETTILVGKVGAAAAVPFNVIAWLEVGKDFVSAVYTIFQTVIERMRPIEYVTAVVLSGQQHPATELELEEAVLAYLQNPRQVELAAYFGMNDDLIRRAREVTSASGWFALTLSNLSKAGLVNKDAAGKLTFKAKHYEIGWKEE